MRRIKTLTLEEPPREVTFRELTVAEIRNWLVTLEKAEGGMVDFVSEGLLEEASLSDVVLMSDLSMDELNRMAPSEIEVLIPVCRELNPRFFSLRHRLVLVSQTVAQAQTHPHPIS
ncbi:MAG: hypothetical protein HQL84_18865 [Magnetococcales bacterium]|nr:hypothetical protein [Magnetococcales bacterium]MBF0152082.1 hypothetical protein [Magnetococcales bacterium]